MESFLWEIFWSIDGELLEHFWCGTLEDIEDL
jgi:hypothetical protein